MASGEGAGRPGGLRQRHVAEYIFSHQRTLQTLRADTSPTLLTLHWLWVCVWVREVRDAARLLRCKKVCFARLVA